MNTQVKKIKAEIERLIKANRTKNGFPKDAHSASQIVAYNNLLSFIDSLPETSGDLEEAAWGYVQDRIDAAGHPGWDWEKQDVKDAYIAGAKWQKEQMPVGWISIKDRVPDTTEYVFTCVKMDGIPQCVGFHYYKNGKWWEGYEEDSVGAVEYWMPIPKFKED